MSDVSAGYRSQYAFRGRLRAEFPSQVIIDATEICNLACIHCPHPQFKLSKHYGGRMLEPELVRKAIDEIGGAGKGAVQYVRFTGEGEPLTHPGIYELLAYAAGNSRTTVTLTTNGTNLSRKRIDKLLGTGVALIDVSIDAYHPETYARIRVNGELAVTRANVIDLLRAVREARSNAKVVVSYVEQPLNAGETAQFEAFWRDQGAEYVVVRRLHSNAGAVPMIASGLRRAEFAPRRPCLYPWERISLTPRGELAFCPQDWVRGSVVADFRTTSIRAAWQGEVYRALREAHLANEFGAHAFCGQCPDWQQTRWPAEGRSYADMVEEIKELE